LTARCRVPRHARELWRVSISPRLGLSMELAVAAMLIVLGAANMTGAVRSLEKAAARQ
jgi:hypothetical protein